MFESATRMHLRFATSRGDLTVEDIWELPLRGTGVTLDSVAIGLNKEIEGDSVKSFVSKRTNNNSVLVLKFDIVKHIIATKLQDAEDAKDASERKDMKQKLVDYMSKREEDERNAKWENMSVAKLKKMANSL